MIFILRHLTHLKTVECDECEKKFRSNSLLQFHKRQRHVEHVERDFTHCSYPKCTAKYKCKGQLRQHVNTIHLGIRKFICDICGQGMKFI